MAKKKQFTVEEVIDHFGGVSKLQARMYPSKPKGKNVYSFKSRGGFTLAAVQWLDKKTKGKFNIYNVPMTGRGLTNG